MDDIRRLFYFQRNNRLTLSDPNSKRDRACGVQANTSTKSHASEKIKSPYFGILRIARDVFFDADSESPHMT